MHNRHLNHKYLGSLENELNLNRIVKINILTENETHFLLTLEVCLGMPKNTDVKYITAIIDSKHFPHFPKLLRT